MVACAGGMVDARHIVSWLLVAISLCSLVSLAAVADLS